jgi:hypothetical protein
MVYTRRRSATISNREITFNVHNREIFLALWKAQSPP